MPRRRPASDITKAITSILRGDQYKALREQLELQAHYARDKVRRREGSRRSNNALTPEQEAEALKTSRYRVKGEWEAHEVEPHLAPLRSSLNMSRVPNYSDERGLRISEEEELV